MNGWVWLGGSSEKLLGWVGRSSFESWIVIVCITVGLMVNDAGTTKD